MFTQMTNAYLDSSNNPPTQQTGTQNDEVSLFVTSATTLSQPEQDLLKNSTNSFYLLTPEKLQYFDCKTKTPKLVTDNKQEIEELRALFNKYQSDNLIETGEKRLSAKYQDVITSITGHIPQNPAYNELKRESNKLISTAKIYGMTGDYPFLKRFVAVVDFISQSGDQSPEYKMLLDLTRASALRIKNPGDKENENEFNSLMKTLADTAERNAKTYSPIKHALVEGGVCLLGTVVIAVALVSAVTLGAAAILGGMMLGAFFIIDAVSDIAKEACYASVRAMVKTDRHFSSQRAFMKLNSSMQKAEHTSFFSVASTKSSEKKDDRSMGNNENRSETSKRSKTSSRS